MTTQSSFDTMTDEEREIWLDHIITGEYEEPPYDEEQDMWETEREALSWARGG